MLQRLYSLASQNKTKYFEISKYSEVTRNFKIITQNFYKPFDLVLLFGKPCFCFEGPRHCSGISSESLRDVLYVEHFIVDVI